MLTAALAAQPAAADDRDRAVSERRVSLERVALGSSLVLGGALFLKAAAPCEPATGCHHEAVAQQAVAWYSIGLGSLIVTKWIRVPVEVRPLPRGAHVTSAVNLGERRKP